MKFCVNEFVVVNRFGLHIWSKSFYKNRESFRSYRQIPCFSCQVLFFTGVTGGVPCVKKSYSSILAVASSTHFKMASISAGPGFASL